MTAAVAGDAAFVKLLIDAGANVAARDTKGRTAVFYAGATQRPSTDEILGLLAR